MAKREYRINVYDSDCGHGNVVGRVRYNNDLDYWDGRNWTNGGTGMHKGMSKLKNGDYCLIIGSQWTGDRDYGYIVTKEVALNEILKSGNDDMLDLKKYNELKDLYDSTLGDTKVDD